MDYFCFWSKEIIQGNKVYEIVWRIQVSPFLLLSEATFASLMAGCTPNLEETEGYQKSLLITTLRQHLADNARMLGSVRHDWDYVRYARSEDVPVVPCSHV